MRVFEDPNTSPPKRVSNLSKPLAAAPKADHNTASVFDDALKQLTITAEQIPVQKPTNLLKSRKTCERKHLSISEILSVDQPIISFGKFISG